MDSFDYGRGGNDAVRLQILGAVDRSLADMTVAEICRKAGVSRKTFYKNFSSKYDIFMWHALKAEERYLDEIGRTLDWETAYRLHFTLLAEERDSYHVGQRWVLGVPLETNPMPRHRAGILMDTLRRWKKIEPDEVLQFSIYSFCKLEVEMASHWFNDGLREPARFAQMVTATVPHTLYSLLNDCSGALRR